MMNCFEARQDFVGFWRGALEGERRRELLAHLKGCSKCDRAFRAFALTAPMLHVGGEAPPVAAGTGAAPRGVANVASQVAPGVSRNPSRDASRNASIDMNGVRRADARRAAEILRRASVYRLADHRPLRQWREAAAGLSAMAAAALILYFSMAAPRQSFDDLLASPDAISETAAQSDADFLGQQIPVIPAASNDIAG